jgi:phosphopantetheinyl transferase
MSFWTRKEAVSKLLGLGMKMNFKELDTAEEKIQLSLLPDKDIILASIDSGNYCLSLAV